MQKINYNILMNKEIEKFKSNSDKPKLLLHACCAPCSSAVLERIHSFFDITVYFYNPNINNEKEYCKRAEELKRLVREMFQNDNVKVVIEGFDPTPFKEIAVGLENEKERGARCYKCYRLRLEKSARYAKGNNFDYFTTTLSLSPLKNEQWLNEIGRELMDKYAVKYLFSDFKKENGYKRSIELSRKYDLYRQNFCGCVYSKRKDDGKDG